MSKFPPDRFNADIALFGTLTAHSATAPSFRGAQFVELRGRRGECRYAVHRTLCTAFLNDVLRNNL